MRALKIHYFLFFAVLMLAAKPFVGFSVSKHIKSGSSTKIFVKAFTKRKQEYIEDGEFDVSIIQKRLINPLLSLTVLFSFLLNSLFSTLFSSVKQATNGILSNIRLSLFPPLQLYLLSGKLSI
jgi:hypothetical protein